MAEDIIQLTSGLYRFIVAAEPMVEADADRAVPAGASLLARGQHLARRFRRARAEAGAKLTDTMDEIARLLGTLSEELGRHRPPLVTLREHWNALATQYEALAHHAKQRRLVPVGVTLHRIKPRNLARNLFHMVTGVVGICLYELVFDRWWTLAVGGSMLGLFVALEVGRRLSPRWNDRLYGRIFARISRPGEAHRICTSTWYLSGLVIGVWLLPQHAIVLGTLVLAFGDPVASLVGKRWGHRKLWADKSAVGTLAFFATALVLCFAYILVRLPMVAPPAAALYAAAVALTGALVELGSTRVNDNLTIPLAAGAVAAALL